MKGRGLLRHSVPVAGRVQQAGRRAGMGMMPLIKPKSNTVHNANGSQAWRKMVDMYHDYLPAFKARYHQHSVIEAVFGPSRRCTASMSSVTDPTTNDARSPPCA